MTTDTQTTTGTQVDAGYETSTFVLGLGVTAATMIGIWSVVCMASSLHDTRLVEILRGLFGAITGS